MLKNGPETAEMRREGQGIAPRVFLYKDKISTVQHTGLKVVNKHAVSIFLKDYKNASSDTQMQRN
jgi:hypothetical protein